jgi:hypothetical protein
MRCIREFKAMVYLGNGDLSLAICYHLHRRLEEALVKLGGLQQLRDKDEGQEWQIEGIVRDIVMALTGKEFDFKERQ